jgi:antigen flippase
LNQVSVQAALNKDKKNSYGQVIKSSTLVGGSTMVTVGLSMVRTKVLAHLLGTAGMGLFGNYDTICNLVRTVAGMGINVSGVRQIADAVGTGDQQKIARTVTSLRRVALFTGMLGGLLLLIFCQPVSRWMFKDGEHARWVALLALAVILADISAGQTALIQGMRRISDLARLNIWGAVYSTVFSIPIIYFYGEAGVVPSLICVAAMTILTSWWYARKVKVEPVSLTKKELLGETGGLLKMGVVFMASGFMTMGAAFAVRAILTWRIGLDASGLYQSAWALGGVYLGYILQAMGADFFPRLTASARDNTESNRLVNEQVEVGLLVAGPGVLAMLALAPLVLTIFYSAKFGEAEDLLRWICMGMLLRVVSWPMGFLLMARGERKLYFCSELVSNALYIGLIWAGVTKFGLKGAGMAFFGSYLLYTGGMYLIVQRLSGFRWSPINIRLAALFAPMVTVVFVSRSFLPPIGVAALGGTLAVVTGVLSLRTLCSLIPLERLPRAAQKMLAIVRLVPAESGI